MAFAQIKLPSAATITGIFDPLGSWFQQLQTAHGLGLASESAAETIAYDGQQALAKIIGDGASLYGIDNAALKDALVGPLRFGAINDRYDIIASARMRPILSVIEQQIQAALPLGANGQAWVWASSTVRPLDALLTRYNANSTNVPATPSHTPTLTATTGGALETTTAGNAPRAKVTYCYNDFTESQPSAASSQVALANGKNAYTLGGFTGNVPAGVTKLRVYRQLAGGTGNYFYDQEVAVVAGVAWSSYVITLTNPDIALRQDIGPPSWLGCMLLPEEAALVALASSTLSDNARTANGPVTFQSNSFLSPKNVAAGPINGFLGAYNPTNTGLFGEWSATVYTEGLVRTSNSATAGLQGFAGAVNDLRFRVTSTLNGTASITDIDYRYFDATNPTTEQTATIAGPKFLTATVGDVVALGVTAGRLVTQLDDLSVATATTGVFVGDAVAARSI